MLLLTLTYHHAAAAGLTAGDRGRMAAGKAQITPPIIFA